MNGLRSYGGVIVSRLRGSRVFVPLIIMLALLVPASITNAGNSAPLVDAVIKGQKKKVVSLLDEGADVDSRDRYGKTALMWAILKERRSLARFLVLNGANVNALDWEKTTCLMWAVVAGDAEMVKMLIQNKAHLQRKDMYGDTALRIATKRGRSEIADVLRNAGAVE